MRLNMVLEAKSQSKTAKIILNLVHLLYYAYNMTYDYHNKVVVNLHASNMNVLNVPAMQRSCQKHADLQRLCRGIHM